MKKLVYAILLTIVFTTCCKVVNPIEYVVSDESGLYHISQYGDTTYLKQHEYKYINNIIDSIH